LPFVGTDVRARQSRETSSPRETPSRLDPRDAEPRPSRAKRGRKPKFEWLIVKAYAFKLLNERGDYESRPAKDWAKQADLEDALLKFMGERFGREAAVSTLRDKIPAWLAEWRKRQVSKGQ
jgi:hypothetical protein